MAAVATPYTVEKYFTIKELLEPLNMSFERLRQLFMYEPDVVVIPPHGARLDRRTKRMYRIPAKVVERVLRRCANPA